MSATTPSMLILPCKDCHQPVKDSETNAYRLIGGILYGWCNECFNKQQQLIKHCPPRVESAEPAESLREKIEKLTDTTNALLNALQKLNGSH
jgi:hypothetical protein